MENPKLSRTMVETSSTRYYASKAPATQRHVSVKIAKTTNGKVLYKITKRILDLSIALIAAILFLPLYIVIACIVALDGGPVLFRHTRIGQNGVPFKCLKFRTMVVNADDVLQELLKRDADARAEWQRDFKLKKDVRVTKVGRFLRQSSLDELPQILNVIRGEMSFVGPRPIVSAEIERYGKYIGHYYACRPGITGLWQVSGRSDTSYDERVLLDARYANTASTYRDLMIMVKTVFVVFQRRGSY
ncbi:sugar transferase [Azospirillum sp. SYSU D00513]|uniref:sugar transferase n=1 Tax=Azospirillum sp. SYSU D00513 TaxID=2812561 RepID=UPI001FFEA831|nr:sugar transferase [Azospirillum sp. SYSU D00513]